MDRLRIKFDNLENCLIQGDTKVPVTRKWGHAWMLPEDEKERAIAWSHLTDVELRRLHRRVGHPSVQRLYNVLQKAGHEIERSAIEQLTKICRRCQLHAPSPHRFKFTLRDDVNFNYEIIVDVMYLEGNRPVLHVVDEATAYNAGRFLKDVSAKSTWEALRLCWIDVYQGPPDLIVTDAGNNFRSTEFRQSAKAMSISVKEVPIEAHNSVGKVERYHATLRRAYDIIRREDPSASPELALQMAFKAINDTAGPNGLVPTLLVYGAYPRMTKDSLPSPNITQRAEAIRKATEAIQRLHAKRKTSDALATRNGLDTTRTVSLPLLSEVCVWREKHGWKGPFRLIATDGENCTLETPRGPKVFRSTIVKPFHPDPQETADGNVTNDPAQEDQDLSDSPNDKEDEQKEIVVAGDDDEWVEPEDTPAPPRKRGRPRKNPIERTPIITIPRRPGRLRKTYTNLMDFIREEYDESEGLSMAFLTAKEQSDAELALQLRREGKITAPGAPFE
jgi:hypothetical protein